MNASIRSGAVRRARGVPRCSIGQRLRRLTHTFSAIFYLTSGVFVLSIVFGGGTHSGFLGDAVLQLMSLPLLWMAIIELLESRELTFAMDFAACRGRCATAARATRSTASVDLDVAAGTRRNRRNL